MRSSTATTTAAIEAAAGRLSTSSWYRRGLLQTWRGRIGVSLLACIVVLGAGAGLIAPYSPSTIDPSQVLQGASLHHLLGSDDLGRDLLSRLLYAIRVSLGVAAGSIVVSLPIGCMLGLLAGYFGTPLDTLLMRPVEMLLALPALLLALTLIAILGSGEAVTIIAIAVIYVPVFARVMRSSTRIVRRELYVSTSRVRGGSHIHIMLRHVLPNAVGPVLAQAAILAGVAILIEAALSYLGLGVQPPTPSLGGMLTEGQAFLTLAPWIEIFPGLVLALTMLAFNLTGDALRSHLDPFGIVR